MAELVPKVLLPGAGEDPIGECVHGEARGGRVRTPGEVCSADPDLTGTPFWSRIRQPPLADELPEPVGAVPRLAARLADCKLSQPPVAKSSLQVAGDLLAGDRRFCSTVVLKESGSVAQPRDERSDEAFHVTPLRRGRRP